ncbi:putative bacterial secretion pathway protein [Herminiimonas arsenicoxydans]|uniref:Bacterial secretion pathway protein n=1 Tax=Herminiimonas arsenicoxydans TaxID=204773 RepID=A4G172_HERAR|nr:putative bacterial secretion pathway protein [Herminiimonas arsenicoxydans]
MKKISNTLRLSNIAAGLTMALCLMSPAHADDTAKSFAEMLKAVPLIPTGSYESEMLAKVTGAVNFIKQQDLPQAQLAINEALQLDARNSHLHFLNGFVYHLQARQGDTQKAEMALEGYQQALRIDPSNWIAKEFLGLAYMDLKQFDNAKLAFSDVLLLTPESSVSIYGLMVSSYLTGDARTACAMADQFQKTSMSTTANRSFIRSSVSVYASCGNFAQADRMRDNLSKLTNSGPEVERVDRRLAQWKSFYLKQEQTAAHTKTPAGGMMKTSLSEYPVNGRPEQLAQAFTSSAPAYRPPPRQEDPVADNQASTAEPLAVPAAAVPVLTPAADATGNGPRMLLIDVVLLSTQELMATSKGINLLSALTLQLGSGSTAAYSRIVTSNSLNGAKPDVSTAITRAVSIPALSYSLNIANANSSVNEVLARPTLAAIEGLPSEFFSGTNLSAGLVSTSQQGGTTIVPLDKRFGIKLSVTPTFLPQGRVQLKIEAQRTALNASSETSRVAYQIEIGELTANANVVMNLGETLLLSGLSEKTRTSTRDGVPGLQDVPVVQYLFSNKKTNDLQRSALILITPRAPIQIAEDTASESRSMALRMKELREKFGFANNNPANVEAIMTQLQSNQFFREFRQGDVVMERWDRMRTTGDRLEEALGFLYY